MNYSRVDIAGSRPFLSPCFLVPHLDRFAKQLSDQGFSTLTIRGYSDSVAHFGTWLQTNELSLGQINKEVISRFAQHYCHCPGGRKQHSLSNKYVRRVQRFINFLEQQGTIKLTKTSDVGSIIPAPIMRFNEHLRLRGLSTRTIVHYERSMLLLFPLLGDNPQIYDAMCIRRVIVDLARTSSLSGVKKLTTALRAFLRFLTVEGLCIPDLDCAVPTVAQWSLSSIPRYITSQEVERVIDSCPVNTHKGLRDRAIILLLSRLGLRAGDIVYMQLHDINWENSTLRVSGKGRREDLLPLPQQVGDAVVDYIDRVRPTVPATQLFLCLNAPHRPFSTSSTVSSIVAAALARSAIPDPPSRGAHLLRHSAATSMLRAGMTLENVSSMLRHRSLDMTAYYAKVDIPRLRQIAQPWPEGTSC